MPVRFGGQRTGTYYSGGVMKRVGFFNRYDLSFRCLLSTLNTDSTFVGEVTNYGTTMDLTSLHTQLSNTHPISQATLCMAGWTRQVRRIYTIPCVKLSLMPTLRKMYRERHSSSRPPGLQEMEGDHGDGVTDSCLRKSASMACWTKMASTRTLQCRLTRERIAL